MKKLIVKCNGQIIDVKHGSEEALRQKAREMRAFYKKCGYNDYKVSVVKL